MGAKKREQTRWFRNPEKERYWSEHLASWRKSGLSVRAYCQESGVIETSFYAWRRELMLRAREQGEPSAAVVQAVKDQRGRAIPARFRENVPKQSEGTETGSPFVQLNLTKAPVAEKRNVEEKPLPSAQEPSLALTILTPSGYSISLNRAGDIDHLAAVLRILDEDNRC
jgi:hypothetical protein